MPGFLPHVTAGFAMFIIGKYYYRSYFEGDNKTRDLLILAVVCLSFSIIPDSFLGIYYTTHILPKSVLMPYHTFFHFIITPISIVALLFLYLINPKRKPIWVMGFWCIVLHIIMDLFIPEMGVLI